VFDNEVSSTDGISPNKYLKDSNNVYRIKEIDINEKVLILEKEKKKFTEIESAQTGFRVPSFSEIDLISKEKVTLENYRGKYVFLDLWTTWCGPCIEEMPKLKVLYDKIDHSKIEFIGIVGQVNFERINKIINDIGINWKLVESTTENLLFNKFKVNHFPTTLLVDPNGIIIRSNIRAEELEKIIEKIP
jgi:thiol-disulfide isomerase/thioredoxin